MTKIYVPKTMLINFHFSENSKKVNMFLSIRSCLREGGRGRGGHTQVTEKESNDHKKQLSSP